VQLHYAIIQFDQASIVLQKD